MYTINMRESVSVMAFCDASVHVDYGRCSTALPLLPSALAGNIKQSVESVCLSVRLSVRLFVSTLLFELTGL